MSHSHLADKKKQCESFGHNAISYICVMMFSSGVSSDQETPSSARRKRGFRYEICIGLQCLHMIMCC